MAWGAAEAVDSEGGRRSLAANWSGVPSNCACFCGLGSNVGRTKSTNQLPLSFPFRDSIAGVWAYGTGNHSARRLQPRPGAVRARSAAAPCAGAAAPARCRRCAPRADAATHAIHDARVVGSVEPRIPQRRATRGAGTAEPIHDTGLDGSTRPGSQQRRATRGTVAANTESNTGLAGPTVQAGEHRPATHRTLNANSQHRA